MTVPRTADVLVIGAGVIGCAVARACAGGGRRVLVVDRGAIGGEASSAAAGVLGVASAWSSSVGSLAAELAVAPVRGQMLAMRAARAPCGVLTAGDAFLVPRPDGETWVGATFEAEGFAKAVTPAGLERLAVHAARLAPKVARTATVVRAWAGLRPSCPGGGPVVGRSRRLANVVVATGHYRSGILLAPITAEAVRACLDGGAPPLEILPFALA